jgi:hypothetical protein
MATIHLFSCRCGGDFSVGIEKCAKLVGEKRVADLARIRQFAIRTNLLSIAAEKCIVC